MLKHTKRQVNELCFLTCVLLSCLSPQFACYFLSSYDGQRKRVFYYLRGKKTLGTRLKASQKAALAQPIKGCLNNSCLINIHKLTDAKTQLNIKGAILKSIFLDLNPTDGRTKPGSDRTTDRITDRIKEKNFKIQNSRFKV